MIECTRHTISVPGLPASLRGIKIAQLTDLHRSRMTSDHILRHAVHLANAAEPDLIVLTGDFVTNRKSDIEPVAHIVGALRARLGVYAILGNHDYSTDAHAMERALTHQGIHLLLNRNVRLENGLIIVGLDDDREGRTNVAHAFEGVDREEPALTLAHNPAVAELVADRNCVVFSGHTHGGQLRVPVITRWAVRKIGAKHYRAGWYTIGRAQLYVNRGLGRVGIPVRFLSRPEISIFTLQPQVSTSSLPASNSSLRISKLAS